MESGFLNVDGTNIYYELRGQGPALLMISGGGGDAAYYGRVPEELADAFTIISFDRRGNSRSGGRSEGEISVAEQSRDCQALIENFAGGQAIVFGSSAGAIIGLDLAARYPETLIGLIAHEPPTVAFVPEIASEWMPFYREVQAIFEESGWEKAIERFQEHMIGAGEWRPESPDELAFAQRFAGNLDYHFGHEMAAFLNFAPDVERLSQLKIPLILAQGALDSDRPYARTAGVIAAQVDGLWTEMPGHHTSFLPEPRVLAGALRTLASQIAASAGLTLGSEPGRPI